MKQSLLLLCVCLIVSPLWAQEPEPEPKEKTVTMSEAQFNALTDRIDRLESTVKFEFDSMKVESKKPPRFQIGGYGEVAMSRMFYSDNYKRYTNAALYKNAPSHGRFDIPHAVLFMSYDFGRGWQLSTEIEFEHGGVEAAVEMEAEETGEYESEIERGGEVGLEQFWIEKSFSSAFNLRMGHIIVPVGLANQYHMPVEFFSVYRSEGEATILPSTWHETGVSLWGRAKDWRYEVMFVAGLDADRFGSQSWVGSGSGSPYEFKIANSYAGAFRVDNYSVKGLRMGLSGYLGNSGSNSLKPDGYSDIKGTVMIGAFDFHYAGHNVIARGNFDYGHLTDSKAITAANYASRKDSPSPKTDVASDAMSTSVEVGYDLFSQIRATRENGHKLYVFGRYEYYDSMFRTAAGIMDNQCWSRQRLSAGLNYMPIKNIVVKAEYASRIFKNQYNNENTVSLGITYTGMFSK